MLLQSILDFLEQDVLKNIVPLKMLNSYGEHMEKHFLQSPTATGVLLLLPTQASYYDAHTYPQTEYVVLFSTNHLNETRALLAQIPHDCNLIFKLMDEEVKAALATIFPWQRVTSFLSYTSSAKSQFVADPDVEISTSVDEAILATYALQGHSSEAVRQQFAQGDAINFALYREGRPVSLCFTYRNYGTVWEIGGVWSDPECRRQGYARRVVGTALHTLAQTFRIPRYQVHELNAASIHLAESLGLIRFVAIEHFLYETGKITK